MDTTNVSGWTAREDYEGSSHVDGQPETDTRSKQNGVHGQYKCDKRRATRGTGQTRSRDDVSHNQNYFCHATSQKASRKTRYKAGIFRFRSNYSTAPVGAIQPYACRGKDTEAPDMAPHQKWLKRTQRFLVSLSG